MPTRLGPELRPDFRSDPAGMPAGDLALWNIWWPTVLPITRRLWFNVRVGPGQFAGPAATEEQKQWWLDLTQARIDAILDTTTGLWLVEVHPAAGLSDLTRLIGYRALLELDNPFPSQPALVLVTDFRSGNLDELAPQLDITIHYTSEL